MENAPGLGDGTLSFKGLASIQDPLETATQGQQRLRWWEGGMLET